MSNPLDETRRAVENAKAQLWAADNAATNMAMLLRGRLRKVKSPWTLAALKRELDSYNIRTQEWKP